MCRTASSVIGIGLALVVVAGCSAGSGIADRIRATNSDLVKDVQFKQPVLGSGEVDVYLVSGTTAAQGHQFWCDVVVTAAGKDLDDIPIMVWSSDPPKIGVNGLFADKRVTCPP